MHWIRPLSDLSLADISHVGGKAAHLGALARAGFPVPPGFVIDISAFIDHFGNTTDPLVRPQAPRLQAELMAEVVQATMDFLGDESELAVRSSSTDEDGDEASYAGLHSTYYFVTPNRLDQAILDCWMSLWSAAALAYRRQGWTEISSGEPVRMAVIVQKMLPATRSGIAFSKDPVTPAHSDVVIEASWGLGAAIVDGRVTPDHIRLSDNGELLSYKVADKQFQVSANTGNKDGSRLQEVALERRTTAVLSETEAEHIANVSLQLETLFDFPQDIEWAYVDEEFYLLQSRPITSVVTTHHVKERLVLFKPLAENFTEPLTPMTEDLFSRVVPSVGAMFEGRFYIDVDKIRPFIPFAASDENLVDLLLLRKPIAKLTNKWSIAKTLKLTGLGLITLMTDGANWMRTSRLDLTQLEGFRNVANNVLHNKNINAPSALKKLMLGTLPFEAIQHQVFFANVSAGRYFLLIGLLERYVAKAAPSYDLDNLSRTYHGSRAMHSVTLVNRMNYLARLLADANAIEAELDESQTSNSFPNKDSNTPIWLTNPSTPEQLLFIKEFDHFLHEFGHRGPREMELAAPTWRESPAALLSLLESQSTESESEDASKQGIYGGYLAARDELNQHLNRRQRRVVNWLTNKIAYYIALRENTRHLHIMAFDVVRRKLLELEQALINQQKLNVPGDIFFLEFAETERLESSTLSPADAHALVRRRRREWQRRARRGAQDTINIDDPRMHDQNSGIVGQCASPGSCEGIARVVLSLHDADKLSAGEILVAPYTDPAWTPLFSRAAGIVVATGSFLSHAGTVARELHVPCVVDVEHCTTAIKSGQRIRVNASAGTVEMLS